IYLLQEEISDSTIYKITAHERFSSEDYDHCLDMIITTEDSHKAKRNIIEKLRKNPEIRPLMVFGEEFFEGEFCEFKATFWEYISKSGHKCFQCDHTFLSHGQLAIHLQYKANCVSRRMIKTKYSIEEIEKIVELEHEKSLI